MALSSDEIVKREIIDSVGPSVGRYYARVFSEGSNDDQRLFKDGGLTFTHEGQDYGSCDCVYVQADSRGNESPVLAIEGTDCLGRGSSGNAQYQRFHHVLGAVKQGILGVYYLRPGTFQVQPDLYGMAYNVGKVFGTPYLIVQDLKIIRKLLELMEADISELQEFIKNYEKTCYEIYLNKFEKTYKNSWEKFAEKRSTIIFNDYIVKYSARNIRNFTDGSQRAGHIAVGEMFLTKYSFPNKQFYYLWPRITREEVTYLDNAKASDKEWSLLRNEKDVTIKTLDDLINLPDHLHKFFLDTRLQSITGPQIKLWNRASDELHQLIQSGAVAVKKN